MENYSANIPPTFNAPVPAHWISKVEQITFNSNVYCESEEELSAIIAIAATAGIDVVESQNFPGLPCVIYLSAYGYTVALQHGEIGDHTPAHYFISQNPLP